MLICHVDSETYTLTLKGNCSIKHIKLVLSEKSNKNISDRICVYNEEILSDDTVIGIDIGRAKDITFATRRQYENGQKDILRYKKMDNALNLLDYSRMKRAGRHINKNPPLQIVLYQPNQESIIPTEHKMGVDPLPKFW